MTMHKFQCRERCGACCIAPSINSPFFGMPNGKPAGVTCSNLDNETMQCTIWNSTHYPDVCKGFLPEREICGNDRDEALQILTIIENDTTPDAH